MSRIKILLYAGAAFFPGCAAVPLPNLTAAHPASPDGQEGTRPAAHSSLRADNLTQKSRAELSAAADAQKEWDEHGPVSGTPPDTSGQDTMNAMPGMDHDKMKGMKHDNP